MSEGQYLKIVKGSKVVIKAQWAEFSGTVISAYNYGNAEKTNWYIEIKCDDCAATHYWKQGSDGGTVKVIA